MIPTLQLGKLRLREVKTLARDDLSLEAADTSSQDSDRPTT